MNVNSEDGISFFSRLRPPPEAVIGPELMSDRLIFVIDLNETKSDVCNAFVYSICKTTLHNHCTKGIDTQDGDNQSKDTKTDDSMETPEQMMEQSLEEDLEQSFHNSQQSFQEMQLSSKESDSSDSFDSMEDLLDEIKPIIMVVDGINGFDLGDFGQILTNTSHLLDMTYTNFYDWTQFVGLFHNELIFNMSLNTNLKLVIIYANPISIKRNAPKEIINLLTSFALRVCVILIVDKLSEPEKNDIFSRQPFVDVLNIKSNGLNKIQIKSERTKSVFLRDL